MHGRANPVLVLGIVAAMVTRSGHAQAVPDSLPAGVTQAMVARGKVVFSGAGICFVCHGSDARGGTAPRLSDSTWIHSHGEYEKIVAVITSGVPAKESKTGTIMPPRGGSAINDEDLKAVAAYVWSLSHRKQ
ncbi:MAG: cytochrome c [Gemmatimonadota bacterium]